MGLLTGGGDESVQQSLQLLRIAGDHDGVKFGTRRLWRTGRFRALTATAERFTQLPWSRRQEGATLTFLAEAGDLLSQDRADNTIRELVRLIDVDGANRIFAGSYQWRWSQVIPAMRRLLSAASPSLQEEVAVWISQHLEANARAKPEERDSSVDNLASLVDGLTLDAVSPVILQRLQDAADQLERRQRWTILAALAATFIPAAAAISKAADAGDEQAARVALTRQGREEGHWRTLARQRAPQVAQMVRDARGVDGHSSFSVFVDDPLHDFTLATFHLRDEEGWEQVCDALDAGVLTARQVVRALGFIAFHYQELPAFVQGRMRALASEERLAHAFPFPFPFDETNLTGVQLALDIATGAVTGGAVAARFLQLQQEGLSREACELLTLWRNPMAVGMLTGLCGHPEATVRGSAAYALLQVRSRDEITTDMLYPALNPALGADAAGSVARAVIQGSLTFGVHLESGLTAQLQGHPSALVRLEARRLATPDE